MNNQSLEKLYKQYAKEVYLYAFSLCKSHHQAEELVSIFRDGSFCCIKRTVLLPKNVV